jgi:peptidoglycan/LPS O-acetylase OafA/YrhL
MIVLMMGAASHLSTKENMPYSAPLDGIRAIAILSVLLFHIYPSALKGGFTGVDIFYVLSGFLITSIISHDLRRQKFSIREFYLRRIQRLLPNVVVMVAAVLLLWTLLMPPSAGDQTGRHGLWTLFSGSNLYIWRNLGGYWGDAAEWSPLTHTWSLGVEEQFYLLFPTSLVLLTRFQSSRVRSWLIAAVVCSFGLCLAGTYTHPVATFYLLPTRVWELLIGAVFATQMVMNGDNGNGLRRSWPGVKVLDAIGSIGLATVVAGVFIIENNSKFPGVISLIPTVGTLFVLVSIVDERTSIAKLFSHPFLVWIGKISYSLYIWHWPLIILGKSLAIRYGRPELEGAIAGGICGIFLSLAAYAWVEQPLRKRGAGRPWRLAIIAAGFSVTVFCAVKVASRPLPPADPHHQFDTPTFYGRLYNAGRLLDANEAPAIRYYDVRFPPLPPRPNDLWRTGGVIHLFGGGQPKVVVFGSSHALMYSKLIDDICHDLGISVAFLGVDGGTPALFPATASLNFASSREALEYDEVRRKCLREWHPDVVFLIDRWDFRAADPGSFDNDFRGFMREVSPFVGHVLFVAQAPVAAVSEQVNLREFVLWGRDPGKGLPQIKPDKDEALRKKAVEIAEADFAEFPSLRVLRADLPFYQTDGSIRYASGRSFFYADNNHLTDAGTQVVRGLFQGAIAEACKPASR